MDLPVEVAVIVILTAAVVVVIIKARVVSRGGDREEILLPIDVLKVVTMKRLVAVAVAIVKMKYHNEETGHGES